MAVRGAGTRDARGDPRVRRQELRRSERVVQADVLRKGTRERRANEGGFLVPEERVAVVGRDERRALEFHEILGRPRRESVQAIRAQETSPVVRRRRDRTDPKKGESAGGGIVGGKVVRKKKQ